MKLEDIGFYTLSDYRARNTSQHSMLYRCELILTDKCNFNCSYCRGVCESYRGTISLDKARHIIDLWCLENLKNVRFSGGEPTLYPHLMELIEYTKSRGVERIAISTNGSADTEYYLKLIDAGVNDFSVSLDACCVSEFKSISHNAGWEKLIANIQILSALTYVSVGVVLFEKNKQYVKQIIQFADSLGVSDIRVITSAQDNKTVNHLNEVDEGILGRNKILKYRIENSINGRNMRGIRGTDCGKCYLCLDDMAVVKGYHFPCIIYLREGGNPIGRINGNIKQVREKRFNWFNSTDTHEDTICKKNCLDVCIDYNNKVAESYEKEVTTC